jgi:hypothetical protein
MSSKTPNKWVERTAAPHCSMSAEFHQTAVVAVARALSAAVAHPGRSVMKPDASRAVGGANAPRVGHKARNGVAQARRAGLSVAVGDLIHPKSPSGAASGTTRRPSTIAGDAAPLGLGVRGRCAWATKMPALRASRGTAAARAGDRARTHGPNQPVEATETRGSVSSIKSGDRRGGKGLRASPRR